MTRCQRAEIMAWTGYALVLCVGACWLNGCTSAQQRLTECAGAAALRVLPQDPMQATAADAVDVAQRLRACRERPDGGSL